MVPVLDAFVQNLAVTFPFLDCVSGLAAPSQSSSLHQAVLAPLTKLHQPIMDNFHQHGFSKKNLHQECFSIPILQSSAKVF